MKTPSTVQEKVNRLTGDWYIIGFQFGLGFVSSLITVFGGAFFAYLLLHIFTKGLS